MAHSSLYAEGKMDGHRSLALKVQELLPNTHVCNGGQCWICRLYRLVRSPNSETEPEDER